MKTLDEVIDAMERCSIPHYFDCKGCPYEDDDAEVGCRSDDRDADALHYLKNYKKDQEDPDGDHQQLIKAQKLLGEFFQNDPLTWNELRAMAGKPVWLVHEGTGESSWVFVGEWFDDDEMRVCRMLRDYADYITKEIYENGTWRAYRKERE